MAAAKQRSSGRSPRALAPSRMSRFTVVPSPLEHRVGQTIADRLHKNDLVSMIAKAVLPELQQLAARLELGGERGVVGGEGRRGHGFGENLPPKSRRRSSRSHR